MAGLGNPGKRYAANRHNIGFHVVDAFAAQQGLRWESSRPGRGQVAKGNRYWLLKPETFMNRSGEAVRGFADYHHIEPSQILIIYDDLDLPTGRLRLRDSGGHGGHNGLRSICDHLDSRAISRLRFGIGRPETPVPIELYVLQDFTTTESETVRPSIQRACDAIDCALTRGFETAKNQYNPINPS